MPDNDLSAYASRDSTTSSAPMWKRWCRIPAGTRHWTLEYTMRGTEKVIAPDATETHVTAGGLVVLSPGTPRNLGQHPKCSRWVRFYFSFVPRASWETTLLKWPDLYPGAKHLTVPPALRPRIEKLLQEAADLYRSTWDLRDEMVMNLLEQVLLWCHTVNPNSRQANMDARINTAQHYILRHFEKPITTSDVARQVGLSRAYFIRLFHQQTGKTPRQFIESCRIEEARWLLHARNHTVSEVAYACGFHDPARFSRVFKARTGKSPSDSRHRSKSY